jgi:hypothetical protein
MLCLFNVVEVFEMTVTDIGMLHFSCFISTTQISSGAICFIDE